MNWRRSVAVWLFAGAGFAAGMSAFGGEESAEPPPEDETPADRLLERVRVGGDPATLDRSPGSVTYLDREILAEQSHDDLHRILLSRVPGVSVQEEDGYGLRPNIGMRGSGSERSSKITLLEDGVLIAPAPYAAPSAYYFPTAARMEGIEVRKGSSSIRQGPFTNGGVLNMISSRIPDDFGGEVELYSGNDETLRGGAKIGDSGTRFAWMFETYQLETAGFKRLDSGGETGFDLSDYLFKMRIDSRPGAATFQSLEWKLGTTEQQGNETYLGLTDEDFAADPFRRYAASQLDRIDSDHDQIQARYLLRPSDRWDFTSTVYRNDFFRNWYKLESVNGVSLPNVLEDPAGFGAEMNILRANLAVDSASDALSVRANRRDYYSQGLQTTLGLRPEGTGSRHSIEIGLRYHEDEEDRFQENDGYRMTTAGRMLQTSDGAPGSQSNRISSAEAWAAYLQDEIALGDFTVTAGVRLERIDFERIDFADPQRSTVSGRSRNRLDEWIPGVGAAWSLGPRSTLFGGIHRGFAPPGASAVDTGAEESINYELGWRGSLRGLRAEIVSYFNDYQHLLGSCTVSSGCSSAEIGDVFDGGKAFTRGLETGMQYDFELPAGIRVPIALSYTLTQGEFESDFVSAYDPWGDVRGGDELPYLPRHQGALSTGLTGPRWSTFTELVWVDEARSVAGQGPIPASQTVDGRLLVDLSGTWQATSHVAARILVRNLFDETYVAARRPAGLRPGINRQLMLGGTFRF